MKTIEELEFEKAELEIQLKLAIKLKKLQHDNPMYMLANILHDIHCCDNHTDGCGWFYFDWDTPHPNGPNGLEWSRSRYLTKAKSYADMNTGMDIGHLVGQTLKLSAVLEGF